MFTQLYQRQDTAPAPAANHARAVSRPGFANHARAVSWAIIGNHARAVARASTPTTPASSAGSSSPTTPVPSAGRWPSTAPGLWWPPGPAEPGHEEMAVVMPGGCVPSNPAAPAVTASHPAPEDRPRGRATKDPP